MNSFDKKYIILTIIDVVVAFIFSMVVKMIIKSTLNMESTFVYNLYDLITPIFLIVALLIAMWKYNRDKKAV